MVTGFVLKIHGWTAVIGLGLALVCLLASPFLFFWGSRRTALWTMGLSLVALVGLPIALLLFDPPIT